jgi:hypothetical protein
MPFAPARSKTAAADAGCLMQIVETSGWTYCVVS